MFGHNHISLKQTLLVNQLAWQDVRLMNSQKQDSFGGTQSMTGKLWIKMDILGGLSACARALRFMTSFVLTISADLNLIGKSQRIQKQLQLVSG